MITGAWSRLSASASKPTLPAPTSEPSSTSCAVAALALANLIVSGQPWGVVYGLGLWGAKAAASLGVDLSASAFWSARR